PGTPNSSSGSAKYRGWSSGTHAQRFGIGRTLASAPDMGAPWWTRPGLEAREGRLLVAGRDAEAIAREHGTPVSAYDLPRIEEQARGLIEAFERAGVPFRLRLALKAQRDPEVLAFVRGLGTAGVDPFSPGGGHPPLEP